MSVKDDIKNYIASQPEAKSADMLELNKRILKLQPKAKLWFEDGKNEQGKVVSNPNIGYGAYTIKYTNGTSREFFRIGLSANTTGISVYVMGLADKKYLADNYGKAIGKASVTGYCIKFKSLKDIDVEVLEEAVQYGFAQE
ncbi:MAG: DUF1801 domain-containing protein [Bacteroidetes bacterium]|nr:DUF1801 domain-containing protein [Bacteroidota bacterium]